ncbi:chemotaxis protein CheB [Flavobacterium zepuense]|uniref:protein-glutamate methylesterase n=1 Tax=Flavobacterium zepuense TaxID=2593302 RepID=A0A552UZP8_9FLAO|nr:chemotaxis protein CheB [Flavobacterium zepuense]
MEHDRIIVIGASAGGLDAIKKLVERLPPDFRTPIFIVWHMAPGMRGIVPDILNKLNAIYAAHALDNEVIKPNRIYIAPPDHHLLLEEGIIRLSRGPKENHFRPAVDPLFRSAAYNYGNRVIGIVLSGRLDDGTAGLWRIKHSGGIAIVQDPDDAEVPSMPANAAREVAVDYCIPVKDMAAVLTQLSTTAVPLNREHMKDEKTKIEIGIAAGDSAYDRGSLKIGELSPYTCPECQGVLSKITDGDLTRYRCHTGHAYSVDTLLASITEKIEGSLYNAMAAIEESMMLLNHIGDHLSEVNHPQLAALYFKKAKDAELRADLLRDTVMGHEQLSNDRLLEELYKLKNAAKE